MLNWSRRTRSVTVVASMSAAVVASLSMSSAPVVALVRPATTTSTGVTLPSTDNIWAAGANSAPSGTLPQAVAVTSGSIVTLDSAAGTWSCNSPFGGAGNQQGPDGNGVTGQNCDPPVDYPAYNNLSGIYDGSRAQFITGVFLGASGPPASAPARLDFTDGTGLGHSFDSLSPQLGQMFFIGDGLTGTGTGTTQQFIAPSGATELYLGYTDDPSAYGDNQNAVTATVNVTGRTGTAVALAASPNPVSTGQPTTLTATVSPLPDGGTVSFAAGGVPIGGCGGVAVDVGTGQATCNAAFGSASQQAVVASYSGTSNFAPAVSPTLMVNVAPVPTANAGYWLVGADGGVFALGNAHFEGSLGGLRLNAPVVAMAPTADGLGYWLVGADGGVFALGDAHFEGSLAGLRLNAPIRAMAPTADGLGYWLVGADGGVFALGDAHFEGSLAGLRLNAPIGAMAPTADGLGYWLVGADGGVFALGDARFEGSLGGLRLNAPIVAMAPTADGLGYWLVGADGGVFALGDARYEGSLAGLRLNAPMVAMAPTADGLGYWLAGADGGVFAVGDARFEGSLGGLRLNAPIVAMAPTPPA
jgi:hypothetical protein